MFFETKSPFKENIKTEKAQLPMHVGRVKCSRLAERLWGVFVLFKHDVNVWCTSVELQRLFYFPEPHYPGI